jgi:hypothetical protein
VSKDMKFVIYDDDQVAPYVSFHNQKWPFITAVGKRDGIGFGSSSYHSVFLSVFLSIYVFVRGTTSPVQFRSYSKFVIIFFNTSTCAALNFNSGRSRVRILWYC